MGIAALTKSAELVSPELHVLTQGELRNLQLLLVDMMNDVALICQEYDIPWSLAGGSALGAVRHQGFIPWDDDMDMSMFRADFDRFKEVFPGRLSEKYELKLPGDRGYLYQFPKIMRKNTISLNIQSEENDTEGVSIDIFLFENVSNHKWIRMAHGLLCNSLLMIDSVMRMKRCKHNLLKYGCNSIKLCRAAKKRAAFAFLFRILNLEQWLRITDWVFALCKDASSKYIVIPSGNGHFFGELYLRSKMQCVIQLDFEGRPFYVPEDTDYLLRTRYGDNYMEIPPEQEREKHAFIHFDLGCVVDTL